MEVEIDDSLYSRQRYVLGDGAMKKLAKSHVLVLGLGGVGVELAKNVILAGVKSVTLCDQQVVLEEDLGTQFFIRKEDVENGLSRAQACCKRLAELNPYVEVNILESFSVNKLDVLLSYQCVIATEMLFEDQIPLNNFCRQQTPAIPFISCDVCGVFSYLFCDFGNEFHVFDATGEESKDVLIASISKETRAVVTTLEEKRHGLEDGDKVMFQDLQGMTELNDQSYHITYINPYSFSVDCDTRNFETYLHGGTFKKIRETVTMTFSSLESQMKSPAILFNDLSKLEIPMQCLVGLIAVNELWKTSGYNTALESLEELITRAEAVNTSLSCPQSEVNKNVLECLKRTCTGKLSPLCATVGGITAQEVLKAVSGKFSPLKQWLLIDAMEVIDCNTPPKSVSGRYNSLTTCLNDKLIDALRNLKLFMVGCGAIGCEMLKNFALLGVSASDNGLITITDNDLIEKSNLNRQFLFRPWHIQKAKSTTAAASAMELNPDLHILAQQNKVCAETQGLVYTDCFFEQQDIVVNALDNVEARRYVDGRCVSNKKALLETGTMGPKGHVQVIVPYITESYSNQRDPVDQDVPYCTLKSFPQNIEHTIQWARDKFESLFNLKPSNFNKFWNIHSSPGELLKELSTGGPIPDGFADAVQLLRKRPSNWLACLKLARLKFDQYFNHKALQLLHVFPLETKLTDGSWFWQSPKRAPSPISFSIDDPLHVQFVGSYAKLAANINKIPIKVEDLFVDQLKQAISNHTSETLFTPSSKKIETDEDKKATGESDPDKMEEVLQFFKSMDCSEVKLKTMECEQFEKDDDENGHIDFITAASNLRATMYNINPADRYETKRIAGKIIPAIATTTAAIAGLATIEFLKVIAKQPIENLKNCFLNLALPMMVLSEPGPAPKTKITDDLEFSAWDQWQVFGNKNFTLAQFMQHFKDKYNLNVSMVCQGVKMIYVPFMPGHKKRVNDSMLKLLKPSKNVKYMDLVIAFENKQSNENEDDDDLSAPPVRYHFNTC